MLVRNFYAALGQFLVDDNTNAVITTLTGSATKIGTMSQHYLPFFGSGTYSPKLGTIPTVTTSPGIFFGNGTTASFEQTTLPDTVYNTQSGFSATASEIERTVTAESATAIAKYTITNNSDSEITISSISACAAVATGVTYLVDHTILESPITIPVGGVGQVTYTIQMNYPTA